MNKLVDKILDQYQSLKAKRSYFENEWQEYEVAYGLGSQNFRGNVSKPFKPNMQASSYGQLALNTLVNFLLSGLISSGTKWLSFVPEDKTTKLSYQQQDALEKISNIVLNVFNAGESKWNTAFAKLLTSMITFGCGNIHVYNGLGSNLSFSHIPLSQYYIRENSRGKVDYILRAFKLTARQAVEQFGADNIHENVLKALEQDDCEEFEFVHASYKDVLTKESKECYIDVDNRHVISESVLDYIPFVVGRWAMFDGEVYGHGQAKLATSALRAVNHIRKQTMISLEFANNPVMLLPDDGVVIPDVLRPGSKIFGGMSDLDGRRRIDPLNPTGTPQAGQFLLEMEKEVLNALFYLDKISPPIDKTRRTAYESTLIQQSQTQSLTGHIANIQNEVLIPVTELVFKILEGNGVFKEYAEVLGDMDLEPEFLSPLARLLKMEDVRAEQQMLQLTLPLLQFNPQLANKINFEKIMLDAQQGTGAPITSLRSEEEYQQLSQAQQQQAQNQMGMQNALAASEITKNIGGENV